MASAAVPRSSESSSLIEQDERDTADDADDAKAGVASSWSVALNVFGIICYPLSAPYAFGRAGWIAGMAAFVFAGLTNYLGAYCLGDICVELPHLTSYPAIAREAYGPYAGTVVDTLQWLGFFMLAVYNIVLVGEYLSMTGWDDDICQKEWMPIMAAVLLFPCMIPSWNDLSWLALVFLALAMGTAVILIEESVSDSYCRSEKSFSDISFFSIMQGTSAMAFCFGGSPMFPEVIQEMVDRRDFISPNGSLNTAYALITPLYLASGILGFAAFGNACEGNVLINFSDNALREVSLVSMGLMLMFGTIEANQLLSKKVEGQIGVHPTAWLVPRTARGNAPPGLVRAVVRTCLLGLELFCALAFFKDGAGALQSLTGAIAGIPLSMLIPFVLHLKLLPDRFHPGTQLLMQVLAGMSIVAFALGSYAAVSAIVEGASSYQFFGGECNAEDTVTSKMRCTL